MGEYVSRRVHHALSWCTHKNRRRAAVMATLRAVVLAVLNIVRELASSHAIADVSKRLAQRRHQEIPRPTADDACRGRSHARFRAGQTVCSLLAPAATHLLFRLLATGLHNPTTPRVCYTLYSSPILTNHACFEKKKNQRINTSMHA